MNNTFIPDFTRANRLMSIAQDSILNPKTAFNVDKIKVGVDLGTMFTVIVVCDESDNPICVKLRQTDIVRDGLVVDYIGARRVVAELKKEVEDSIGIEIKKASIAIPPNTSLADSNTHKYVVEGAGIEVQSIEYEPNAANMVLGIKNGAVVDIGGGTTGTSIIQDGKVVHSDDDATGGIHFTYVIAGNFKIPFEEAERFKVDKNNKKEVLTIVTPVIQKVASIIKKHASGYSIENIVLCGGTSTLEGIENVIESSINIKTYKPENPFLITPVGIALSSSIL